MFGRQSFFATFHASSIQLGWLANLGN